MQLFLILGLLVAIVAVVFALQNSTPITVSLLVWRFEGSLALVLLIALTLGVITSLLVSAPTVIRRSRGSAGEKKKIQQLESSLAERDKKIQELEAMLQEQRPTQVQEPETKLPERTGAALPPPEPPS